MSDIRRVQSVTVKDAIKYHRHNTANYISEVSEDGKRQEFELTADYTRRVITIKHCESGSQVEVDMAVCKQWNLYADGAELPGAKVTEQKRKAG